MIDAPHAGSSNREIQEHEAVDDSQLTCVFERKKAPRCVGHEICHRHVASQDECDRTSEQAEHDQHAADDSIMPLMPGRDMGATPVLGETGKLKYFEVPCSRNSRPTMIRKILNTRGDHVTRKLSIVDIRNSPVNALRFSQPFVKTPRSSVLTTTF